MRLSISSGGLVAASRLQGRTRGIWHYFFELYCATWAIWGPICAPTGFRRADPLGVSRCIWRHRKNLKIMYFWQLYRENWRMQNNEEHNNNDPIHKAFPHVLALAGSQKSSTLDNVLEAFWRHLVDFGSRFGAHWILKGFQSFKYDIGTRVLMQN